MLFLRETFKLPFNSCSGVLFIKAVKSQFIKGGPYGPGDACGHLLYKSIFYTLGTKLEDNTENTVLTSRPISTDPLKLDCSYLLCYRNSGYLNKAVD
jgi:hypothetical protein